MFNPKKRKIDLEVKLNTEYDWDYREKSFVKEVIWQRSDLSKLSSYSTNQINY